jgi:hypothetical protein
MLVFHGLVTIWHGDEGALLITQKCHMRKSALIASTVGYIKVQVCTKYPMERRLLVIVKIIVIKVTVSVVFVTVAVAVTIVVIPWI